MRRHGKFFFAHGLQKAVLLLRSGGLLETNKFPKLLTSVRSESCRKINIKGEEVVRWRYLLKIGIRDDFNPSELWLRFDRRGTSIYISPDQIDWVCLKKLYFKK